MTPAKINPIHAYGQYVKEGKIADDAAQRTAVAELQRLYDALDLNRKNGFLGRLLPSGVKGSAPRGIYLWGDVGRGKSMLMDMFYASLATNSKQRLHFYSLMLGIHKTVHQLRKKHIGDPIGMTAHDLAKKYRILCLDEFQVTDVADAMILKKLFSTLLEENVAIVMTSNRKPEDLYQGGLQREKFLDFVQLVYERMDVVELKSPHDYRMQKIKDLKSTYFTPLDKKTETKLQAILAELTNHAKSAEVVVEVQGRELPIHQSYGKVAHFTFSDLCEKPLGSADYMAVAEHFDTVFISGIPELSPEKRNESRRFVALIDSLYDHRVKLICTAAVAPEKLYREGDGSFEFERTVSRLNEMQSEGYRQEAIRHAGEVV